MLRDLHRNVLNDDTMCTKEIEFLIAELTKKIPVTNDFKSELYCTLENKNQTEFWKIENLEQLPVGFIEAALLRYQN